MKARLLLFMFGGLLFVIPLLVEAQSGLVGCTGAANCNFCAFTGLFQSIINFLIGLSIPLSALLFAWAGILYFSSAANPAGIETAKKPTAPAQEPKNPKPSRSRSGFHFCHLSIKHRWCQ